MSLSLGVYHTVNAWYNSYLSTIPPVAACKTLFIVFVILDALLTKP